MEFDKDFLLKIVNRKTRNGFFPFSLGDTVKTEEYLNTIVGRLKEIHTVIVNADFNHFGSGFSSFVPVYLFKKIKGKVTPFEEVNGIIIYLCRLAPYAVWGKGSWRAIFDGNKWNTESFPFLVVEEIGSFPDGNWFYERELVANVLNLYQITLLTKDEIEVPVNFKIEIPTVLNEGEYRIFDCLFYWED